MILKIDTCSCEKILLTIFIQADNPSYLHGILGSWLKIQYYVRVFIITCNASCIICSDQLRHMWPTEASEGQLMIEGVLKRRIVGLNQQRHEVLHCPRLPLRSCPSPVFWCTLAGCYYSGWSECDGPSHCPHWHRKFMLHNLNGVVVHHPI